MYFLLFSLDFTLILLSSYSLCSITALKFGGGKEVRTLGGGKEVRTPDPLLAKQVLSQLSYTPK